VRQLIADGLLRVVRVGARVRIRPADLSSFVEERLSPPAASATADGRSDIGETRALPSHSFSLPARTHIPGPAPPDPGAAESDRQDAKEPK
jgi:hypothetical protein